MHKLTSLVYQLDIWSESRGQDLVEYALMAAFVATAAGAITPQMMVGVSVMFSRVGSVLIFGEGELTVLSAFQPKNKLKKIARWFDSTSPPGLLEGRKI